MSEPEAETATVSVRMPPAVLGWIKAQAAESMRSLSAEVVWQLRQRQQAAQQKEVKQ